MSVGENIRFNRQEEKEQPRVNLNSLMERVKEEEKKTKRNNLVISAAALLAVAVFGVILTL
jgi:hypothetical protein